MKTYQITYFKGFAASEGAKSYSCRICAINEHQAKIDFEKTGLGFFWSIETI